MPSLVLNIDVKDNGTVKVKTFREAVAGTRGPMDQFGSGTKQMSSGMDRVAHSAHQAGLNIRTMATGMLAANAIQGTISAVKEQAVALVDAGRAYQGISNTLKAVEGTTAGAAREYQFVRQEAKRLGLDLESTARSYAQLAAASKGTALEGQGVRDIFTAIAEAGTVYNLNAQKMELSLYAIQQMMSKGKVTSEELRRQLGDNLPKAFGMAAEAMGVTTAELDKMMRGEIWLRLISSPDLPK